MFSQPIFLQGLGMGASLIMPIGAQASPAATSC
jgi:L-lysine exporter family protein LysE/ArgO